MAFVGANGEGRRPLAAMPGRVVRVLEVAASC